MLKKVLLILSLASITLFATQSSRVNSLAGFESGFMSGSNSAAPIHRSSIYDPTDVMIFPHLSNQYTDTINIFYSGVNSYNGFATFNIMPGLTLGASDYNASKQMQGVAGAVDFDGTPLALSNHTYSIFGAYSLGMMNLGLSLDYWSSNLEHEFVTTDVTDDSKSSTKETISTGIFTVNLSLGMDLGNSMGFDSMFKMGVGSYTNKTYDSEDTQTKTRLVNAHDAYTQIELGGRFFMDITNQVKLTSWIFLNYNSEGYKDLTYNAEGGRVDTVKHENSEMLINLGTSFQIEAMKNKLFVTPSLGLLISSISENTENLDQITEGSKNELNDSVLAIPYIGLAVEYNITKWLSIYSGYNKAVLSTSSEEHILGMNSGTKQSETTDTKSQSATNSNFAMGISLQNDTMKFIASLNKDILLNGPNFISGTTNPMFVSATFQWNFGKPEKSNMPKVVGYKDPVAKKIVTKKEKKVVADETTEEDNTTTEEEDSL